MLSDRKLQILYFSLFSRVANHQGITFYVTATSSIDGIVDMKVPFDLSLIGIYMEGYEPRLLVWCTGRQSIKPYTLNNTDRKCYTENCLVL